MQFPKLTKLSQLAKDYEGLDFSNVTLIAVQHLLATNGSLFELLDGLGLSYKRMFLLGKVYSTNEAVYTELIRRHANVSSVSTKLASPSLTVDYKVSLYEAALALLREAVATLSATDTLLVVDDGGVLITVIHDHLSLVPCKVVCVEQTRSGAETARALVGIDVPVVNVAESKTKLVDESPYIATSIIEQLNARTQSVVAANQLQDSAVLVVGMGAIGSEVARQIQPLVRHLNTYDIKAKPITGDLEAAIAGSNVVIGCVGKRWLPQDRTCIKASTIFVSGSSSNTEFLGLNVNFAASKGSVLSFQDKGLALAHADYQVEEYSWVLNAGFPINFDGSQDPIEPKVVELTRLLMLAGMLQAVSNETLPHGLVPLDDDLQASIKSFYVS